MSLEERSEALGDPILKKFYSTAANDVLKRKEVMLKRKEVMLGSTSAVKEIDWTAADGLHFAEFVFSFQILLVVI